MFRIILFSIALALPLHASATGLMTCDSGDRSNWIAEDAFKERITAKGWQIRFMKEDGGCWEVYGTSPDEKRVEAYFHPVSGELLLISQRGRTLYRAGSSE